MKETYKEEDLDEGLVWLEEEEAETELNQKREYFIVMLVMAMIMILSVVMLYRFVIPWLFNTQTDAGFIAAALLLIMGWVPFYLLYFKVLRPLFKEVYR